MLEIVVLPLVVFPVIGVVGMMFPLKSVKSPLQVSVVMWLQLVAPVHSALPTLTVVT